MRSGQFTGESAQTWINLVGMCQTIEFTSELLPLDLPCAHAQDNLAVNFCKHGDITSCDNQCAGQFSGEHFA